MTFLMPPPSRQIFFLLPCDILCAVIGEIFFHPYPKSPSKCPLCDTFSCAYYITKRLKWGYLAVNRQTKTAHLHHTYFFYIVRNKTNNALFLRVIVGAEGRIRICTKIKQMAANTCVLWGRIPSPKTADFSKLHNRRTRTKPPLEKIAIFHATFSRSGGKSLSHSPNDDGLLAQKFLLRHRFLLVGHGFLRLEIRAVLAQNPPVAEPPQLVDAHVADAATRTLR